MAITLLETFETLMHSEFIRTTARQLGESESAVSTAITGAGTATMARLAQLAGDAGLMARVATLVGGRGDDGNGASGLPTSGGTVLVSTTSAGVSTALGRGTSLLNMAFGPRLQELVVGIAEHSGISQPSARAAIGHAAPLVLKALAERLEDGDSNTLGLAPTGARLTEVLLQERDALVRNIPPELFGTSAKGQDKPVLQPRPTSATTTTRSATASAGAATSESIDVAANATAARHLLDGAGLSPMALTGGLIGLAFLWWLFLPGFYAPYSIRTAPSADPLSRSSDKRAPQPRAALPAPDIDPRTQALRAEERDAPPRPQAINPGTSGSSSSFSSAVSSTPSSRTAPAPVTGLLRFIKRTLPSNKQIDFAEDGIEGRMMALIENRSLPLSRTQWLEFDRLHFHTGSSNLTAESRAQVQNIADILSAYPSVRIKIGGYTDNVGEPAANQRLSEARAQRVMTELITLGINALRLEAEGYGEQHPIADNATPEGRARNRRIAVRVIER